MHDREEITTTVANARKNRLEPGLEAAFCETGDCELEALGV